jgi:hypothetical protein
MKEQTTFSKIAPSLVVISLIAVISYFLVFLAGGIDLPFASPQTHTTSLSPGELSAYRWNAMAQAYEQAGLLNNSPDAADISAYRWNAMAQAYKQAGLLNFHNNPDDLLAYRWNAMAQAYKQAGLLNTP